MAAQMVVGALNIWVLRVMLPMVERRMAYFCCLML
jgi:hypothetical protein